MRGSVSPVCGLSTMIDEDDEHWLKTASAAVSYSPAEFFRLAIYAKRACNLVYPLFNPTEENVPDAARVLNISVMDYKNMQPVFGVNHRIRKSGDTVVVSMGIGDISSGMLSTSSIMQRIAGASSSYAKWLQPEEKDNVLQKILQFCNSIKLDPAKWDQPFSFSRRLPDLFGAAILDKISVDFYESIARERYEDETAGEYKKYTDIIKHAVEELLQTSRVNVYSPALNDIPYAYVDANDNYKSVKVELNQCPDSDRLDWVVSSISRRSFDLFLSYSIPLDIAAEMTQAESPEKVNLANVSTWVQNYLTQFDPNFKGRVNSNVSAWYITPVSKYQRAVLESNDNTTGKPRQGYLNLMMTNTKHLQYVPDVANGPAYEDMLNERHLDENGVYCSNISEEREKQFPLSKVSFLLTDWSSHRLVRLSGSGRPEVVDISGWAPARPYQVVGALKAFLCEGPGSDAICRALAVGITQHIITPQELLGSEVDSFLDYGDHVPSDRVSYISPSYLKDVHNGKELPRALRAIIGAFISTADNEDAVQQHPWLAEFKDMSIAEYGRISLSDIRGDSNVPFFVGLYNSLFKIGSAISTDPVLFTSKFAPATYMTDMPYLVAIAASCTNKGSLERLNADNEDDLKPYGHAPMDIDEVPKDYKMRPLSNVAKGINYLPHQAKARFVMDQKPQFKILDVSAGGGKTILVLSDVNMFLEDHPGARCLIMCPGHLVGDYVREANYFTGGRINVIPLFGEGINRWGADTLRDMILRAPANTVVVVSYDMLNGGGEQWSQCLGDWIQVFPNTELLRSIGFDAAWCDESQYLKNEGTTQRVMLARRVLADIPVKTLASGTTYQTRLTDVVNQLSLLDPGIFGNGDTFSNNEQFGDGTMGVKTFDDGRTISMASYVAMEMKKYVSVITCRRKEWAALLPPRKINFHYVEMTQAQKKVYRDILQATLDEIMKDPAFMARLKQAQEDGDEEFLEKIDSKLQEYLQRLEMFMSDPSGDPNYGELLEGADAVSPKSKKLNEIVTKHIKEGIPGKILVFCLYGRNAKALYNNLPPDIRRRFIFYTAAKKVQCKEQFENDPEIIGMIGIESSMNTGINAQFASRLIRIDAVWSPGTLEQGESRTNRPNIKKDELRPQLYNDWILINESIDVVKTARLVARVIDRSKYDNATDPLYQSLTPLRLVTMSLDISTMSDLATVDNYSEYMHGYLDLVNRVEADTLEEYRQRHSTMRADLKAGKYKVARTDQNIEGSAILRHVPYAPGCNMAHMGTLGLVPYLEYERDNFSSDFSMKGVGVHTEAGEGICTNAITGLKLQSKPQLTVKFPSGESMSFPKDRIFIMTKDVINHQEIRESLADQLGMKTVDVVDEDKKIIKPLKKLKDTVDKIKKAVKNVVKKLQKDELVDKDEEEIEDEDEVPPVKPIKPLTPVKKQVKEPEPEEEEEIEDEDDDEFWINPSRFNEFICVYANEGWAPKVFAQQGYMKIRKSVSMQFVTYRQLRKGIDALKANYEIPEENLKELETVYTTWSTRGVKNLLRMSRTNGAQLKAYLIERRRKKGTGIIVPNVMIDYEDGEEMVTLEVFADECPSASQMRSKVKVPGCSWDYLNGYYFKLFNTKKEAAASIQTLIDAGAPVSEEDIADIKLTLRSIIKP